MKIRKLLVILLMAMGMALVFSLYPQEKPLIVYMLDIGQGDAIYIRTPNGKTMLVDSGRDRQVLYELGDITKIGKKNIDIIENSNPDLDHIGGIPFVMDRYKIGTIISAGTNHDSLEAFNLIESKAKQAQIPILKPKQGTTFVLDKKAKVTYTILWPQENVRDWERNAGSLVGLLEYSGHKVLLTGDAPKEVEDQIVSKYKNYLQNIDILKVGHHGSKTSTGENLLAVTHPKFAIISAGKDNRYGHPNKEVIQILQKYNVTILVTLSDGRIVCKIWRDKETECK